MADGQEVCQSPASVDRELRPLWVCNFHGDVVAVMLCGQGRDWRIAPSRLSHLISFNQFTTTSLTCTAISMAFADCFSQLSFVCKLKSNSNQLVQADVNLRSSTSQRCWQTNKRGRGCCHGDAISAPASVDPIRCCKQEVRAKPADYGNVADQVHDGNDER